MEYQSGCDEEAVETYRRYDRFLRRFDDKMSRDELYRRPDLLRDEIESLETENLRLIERCDELSSERDRNVLCLNGEIASADAERDVIVEQTDSLPTVELVDARTQCIAHETDVVDQDLNGLTGLIERYYRECFKKSADITALMMLDRLEIELEKMYAITAKLSQQYLAEKQLAIDRSRREELRRKKQEAQEIEQQRKMKAALERSVLPIHQRTGRPVNARMLPGSSAHHNVDLKQQDEQIQEQLLFGEVG
jgi:hypothetical protein